MMWTLTKRGLGIIAFVLYTLWVLMVMAGPLWLPAGEQDRFWPEYAAAGWELWEVWSLYALAVAVTMFVQPFLWHYGDAWLDFSDDAKTKTKPNAAQFGGWGSVAANSPATDTCPCWHRGQIDAGE